MAVDFDDPEAPCTIDVFVQNKKVVTFFTGNLRRPDVSAGIASLKRDDLGFDIDIKQWLLPIEQEIEFRFGKDGSLVPGGRFSYKEAPFQVELVNGEEGFLFYKADSNDALLQMSRACVRPENEIDAVCFKILAAEAMCRNFGLSYAAMIIPDRAVALAEVVGNSFEPSPKRPALRLVEHAKKRFGLGIQYPLGAVGALPLEKRAMRYDTHLSPYGTFQCLLQLGDRMFPERIARHDELIEWKDELLIGDLSAITGINEKELVATCNIKNDVTALFDNISLYRATHYTWSSRVYINNSVSDGVALIFGTSSSAHMARQFPAFFRVVVHVWTNDIDFELIRQVRPTHVFNLLTEKFLGTLNIDNFRTVDADRICAAVLLCNLPNRNLHAAIDNALQFDESDLPTERRFSSDVSGFPREGRDRLPSAIGVIDQPDARLGREDFPAGEGRVGI